MIKKNILFNMFFAICEDHKKEHIDSFINVLDTVIKKFNASNFDIYKETEKYLVSPVFRKQK